MPAKGTGKNSRWQKRSWRSEDAGWSGYCDKTGSSSRQDGWLDDWQNDRLSFRSSTWNRAHHDNSVQVSGPSEFGGFGIGTWAWGDEKWGYGREGARYDDETLQAAFHTAVDLGVTFFDTSEVYGQTHAETVLGWCLQSAKKKCFIATKWHPRANASVFQKHHNDSVVDSMRRTLLGSKKRLGVDRVDLFQLHSGSKCYGSLEDYADGLASMVQEGHTSYVGVSNVGASQVRRIYQRLRQKHGIQLFANQVEFSLLEPGIATDGTMKECKHLGVKILAYCPLAMGRLTGKYSAENEPQFFGHGNKAYRYHGALPWPHIEKVLNVCRDIASQRNVTIAQVALNWCIEQGTVPIPGAKTSAQALDNCKALNWKLSEVEMVKLNAVAMKGTIA